MGFRIARPDDLEWVTRPAGPDQGQRHVGPLTDLLGLRHTRANLWRLEPRAVGTRHLETVQEETFVVVRGTLSIFLGEPAERHDVAPGGVVHVEPGTALQLTNQGEEDVLLYAHGAPPVQGKAEHLDSAV
jgi:uncharacterized cupin superfamily protein